MRTLRRTMRLAPKLGKLNKLDQVRAALLELAARTYGHDHPPVALTEAAEVFYEYLMGESDEVLDVE